MAGRLSPMDSTTEKDIVRRQPMEHADSVLRPEDICEELASMVHVSARRIGQLKVSDAQKHALLVAKSNVAQMLKKEVGPLNPGDSLLLDVPTHGLKIIEAKGKKRRYRSASSPLRTMGSKRKFQQHLAHLLPFGRKPLFIDAMVGGGSAVLAAIVGRSFDRHWLNDANPSVAAFWNTVRDRDRNIRLRQALHLSRERLLDSAGDSEALASVYLALLREEPDDELAMALRYFLLNRMSYSGLIRRPAGCLDHLTLRSINVLADLPDMLRNTHVTNLCVLDVLKAAPPGAFVFLDPPYFTNAGLYTDGYKDFHGSFPHDAFVEALPELADRGVMFMLTYDRYVLVDPILGPILKQFRVQPCAVKYSTGNRSVGTEIAVMNYESMRSSPTQDLDA